MTGSNPLNLDGLRMHATTTAPGGAIDHRTIFEFRQHGDTVEARYAGGRIALGHLVGVLKKDSLEFRYAQLHDDGSLHGGHSQCRVEHPHGGPIKIVERYVWADGGSGVNVIEQLPLNHSPSDEG